MGKEKTALELAHEGLACIGKRAEKYPTDTLALFVIEDIATLCRKLIEMAELAERNPDLLQTQVDTLSDHLADDINAIQSLQIERDALALFEARLREALLTAMDDLKAHSLTLAAMSIGKVLSSPPSPAVERIRLMQEVCRAARIPTGGFINQELIAALCALDQQEKG